MSDSEPILITEIQEILPHRYPMLLVDRVLETDDETTMTCLKNLTINELFFQGHFPGNPVMPGVLQLEAMAQCAGILLNRRQKKNGQIAYFTSVDNGRFRRMCVPGDTLIIKVNLLKLRSFICKVEGTIHVDGQLASEGTLTFAVERS